MEDKTMKKHYTTPVIKNITVVFTQSPLAGSVQGILGDDESSTMDAKGRRGRWGNLWDGDTEE